MARVSPNELGNVAAFVYEAAKGSPGEGSSPQPNCPSLAPQQGSLQSFLSRPADLGHIEARGSVGTYAGEHDCSGERCATAERLGVRRQR